MPSDKHNSITAKATGLIFSLFDVALAQQVPFGILQNVQCIIHGLTTVLLCVPFIFVTGKGVDLARARDGFPSKWKSSVFFIVAILIADTTGHFVYESPMKKIVQPVKSKIFIGWSQ